MEPSIRVLHNFFHFNLSSSCTGLYEFRHRGNVAQVLGGCPRSNSEYHERLLFLRNAPFAPDMPPFNFPVVWKITIGVGELRLELNTPDSFLAQLLWKCPVHDYTVLCSPELTVYLEVFP